MKPTPITHEHHFVAEKRMTQEAFNDYLSDGRYHTGILDIQEVLIFCTSCGEYRNISREIIQKEEN
jgi:hypothetical protein